MRKKGLNFPFNLGVFSSKVIKVRIAEKTRLPGFSMKNIKARYQKPQPALTRADTLILPNSAIRAGMLSTRVPSLSGRVKKNLS